MKGDSVNNTSHSQVSVAHELVDYAKSQAARAWKAARVKGAPGLPENFIPGYTLCGGCMRGGQGIVYEAVENSTRRRVAIKILWEGPLSNLNHQARFKQEVRILAQLQHPHIVTIHSYKTMEGFSYYVMDYIAGQQLDAYIASTELSAESKIELFLKVCDAVNAAHLRGIVHRDLKPSNIRIDENGEPQVLDFGLAKLLGPGDDETPRRMTTTGQFLGSLPWAAPEQVMEQPDCIDLRTDVYALGMVLYHMLTGTFPYDVAGSSRAVMDTVLHQNAQSPRSFCRSIDDDLSTIVLKCLRKESERRYQIAGELARDLRRYLHGQPIEAKHDRTTYVLSKLVRRHRGLTTALAGIVLLTVAYAASMSCLYRRAASSERKAAAQAADARRKFCLARDAVAFLVGEVTDKLRETAGTEAIRQSILEGAFKRLEMLTLEHGDDPELRIDVARAHDQLAEIALALDHSEQARKHLDAAMEIRSQLLASGQLDEESHARLSINLVHLGDLARHQGDLDAAEGFYGRAFRIDEDLVSRFPENAHFCDNLAWSYERFGWLAIQRGDIQTARAYYRKQLDTMEHLLEIDAENPVHMLGLSAAHARLAEVAAQECNWEAAKAHVRDSVAVARQALTDEPHRPHFQREFLYKLIQEYHYQLCTGDGIGDTSLLSEAKQIAETLVAEEPRVSANRQALGTVCAWVASAAETPAEFQDVEHCWRNVLTSLSLSGDEAVLVQQVPQEYVDTLWGLRRALREQGWDDEARAIAERLLGILKRLNTNGVEEPWLLVYAANVRFGNLLPELRDLSQAVQIAKRAVEVSGASNISCRCVLGEAYMIHGEYKRAAQHLEKVLADLPCDQNEYRSKIEQQLRECRAAIDDKKVSKLP